ncbi:MAG: T9SS type A sorting domain-containing protein [Bacteroidia bacterium]
MKKTILLLTAILFQLISIAQPVWTSKANYPGTGTSEFRAFSINGKVYIGGPTPALWEYEPAADVWTQKATFIGAQRSSPVAFAIGTKGYLGTGGSLNDFYEYDQPTNTWTQKANFGGSGREGALGIAINGKGYVGTGGNYLNDWWEYDPGSDTWTQKANLNGPGRYHGGAFSVGGFGYVCSGFNGVFMNDLLRYDPVNDTWTSMTSLPGATRDRPVGFAIGNKGYIATGWNGSQLQDCWEYDVAADSWTSMPPFPPGGCYNACSAVASSKAYVGLGVGLSAANWWEFGNACTAQSAVIDATCFSACNGSVTITQPDSNAVVSYLWSGGQTVSALSGLCPGTYTVTVTDTSGCVSINNIIVGSQPPMIDTFTAVEPDCNGGNDGSLCVAVNNGLPPYSFIWFNGDTGNCIYNYQAGTYNVTVTDASGCTQSFNGVITQPVPITITASHTDATCATCNDGSAAAGVLGGTPPYTYLWSNGSTDPFLPSLLPGTYSICITDANGCSNCDSVTVGDLTALQQLTNGTIKVNPNPFNKKIDFEIPFALKTKTEVSITDAAGRTVYFSEFIVNSFSINTDRFIKGVYLITLKTNEWIYRQPMIKANE